MKEYFINPETQKVQVREKQFMNNEPELNKLAKIEACVMCAVLALVVGIGVMSCRLGTPDYPDPPNPDWTTNSAARWSPDIQITFPRQPSTNAVALLEFAGAKKQSVTVFVIERYDWRSELHNAALELAYREHAVTKGVVP